MLIPTPITGRPQQKRPVMTKHAVVEPATNPSNRDSDMAYKDMYLLYLNIFVSHQTIIKKKNNPEIICFYNGK